MENLPNYQKEERPWGSFQRFTLNEPSTVKIIAVKAGEAFSLQSHKHRDEFWHILSGSGVITLDDERKVVHTGENFVSPKGHEHRMAGGESGVTFLEISFGEFDEGDITRFEDKYGRV